MIDCKESWKYKYVSTLPPVPLLLTSSSSSFMRQSPHSTHTHTSHKPTLTFSKHHTTPFHYSTVVHFPPHHSSIPLSSTSHRHKLVRCVRVVVVVVVHAGTPNFLTSLLAPLPPTTAVSTTLHLLYCTHFFFLPDFITLTYFTATFSFFNFTTMTFSNVPLSKFHSLHSLNCTFL